MAQAQGFSAHVLPPRFEDAAEAGSTYRNVIEIQNTSPEPVRFGVRTADWDLDDEGAISFRFDLAEGSCRTWAALEAREIRLEPEGRKRFRFEVAVPAGTEPRQCRFAIMIEGDPQETETGVSVAGRIGVVVYLDIGGAAADLRVLDGRIVALPEQPELPLLTVANKGNAHGRLQGFIDGRDANGRRWTLVPANEPILPGRERGITLFPVGEPEDEVVSIAYPLRLEGKLDWRAQRVPVDVTVAR